ncbi:hypothetical protein JHK84_037691 [Glycine max]|nr:hypothetical protein JHK84_037691 [Glycine max]
MGSSSKKRNSASEELCLFFCFGIEAFGTSLAIQVRDVGNRSRQTNMDASSLHIAMFPWFAMGHLTPYLHLSNKLAKRGHRISFFIPKRTPHKLEQFNLFPHLITFFPINVPHVEGLPHGAETTSDVSFSLAPLIMTAMDRTEKDIELLLIELMPQIVFFDFTYWLPNLTRRLGIKSF